jgi:hypothetical protein
MKCITTDDIIIGLFASVGGVLLYAVKQNMVRKD